MAFLLLLLLPALASAQPREVAELYPPTTIAYAELRDPAAIADALAAIVKGTPLADGLKLLHDRKDANKDPRLFHGTPGLAWAATLASPELLAELRKVRGAAVGFLGHAKDHEPKIAACLMLGDGAAGLLIKHWLANESAFRRVATLDGVAIYQSRTPPAGTFDPNTGEPIPPEAKPATEGPCEPTFAYLPGLFVVASNKAAIADLLARHRGSAKDSLATATDFVGAMADRKPGVNLFLRTTDFVTASDVAKKAKKDLVEPALLAHLKLVMNPKAVPVVTGSLAPRADGIALALEIRRDPRQPSALFDLFEGTLTSTAMKVVPSTAAGVLSVGFPAKPKRAAAFVALADALAKADGEAGMLPGERLTAWEKASGLPLRETYLAGVRGMSIVLVPKQALPVRVEPRPLIVLHLDPEANAADWDAAIPRAFAAMAGLSAPVPPARETISGIAVRTLPHAAGAVHYANVGSSWVFGLDRNAVAACGAVAPEKVLGFAGSAPTDTAFAAALPAGLVQFETVQRSLGRLGTSSAQPLLELGGGFGGAFLPPGLLDPGTAPAANGLFGPNDVKKLFGGLPPVTARTARTADRMTVDIRWEFGPAGAKGFVAQWIPILERIGVGEPNPYGRGLFP